MISNYPVLPGSGNCGGGKIDQNQPQHLRKCDFVDFETWHILKFDCPFKPACTVQMMQRVGFCIPNVGVMVEAKIEIIFGALIIAAISEAVKRRLYLRFRPVTKMNHLIKDEKRAISKDKGMFQISSKIS